MVDCEPLFNARKREVSNLKDNYMKHTDINLKIKTDCPRQGDINI